MKGYGLLFFAEYVGKNLSKIFSRKYRLSHKQKKFTNNLDTFSQTEEKIIKPSRERY